MVKFAILDLEYTSWKGSLQRNWSFDWEKKEIINISAIKFNDLNKTRLTEIDIICKPLTTKFLSLYFQKLTGIKQKRVNEQGINFKDALNQLEYFFLGVEKIFVNGVDGEVLKKNCKYHKLSHPLFIKKIIDIRPYLSKILNKDKKKIISSELVKNESKGFFIPHTGLYDCYSIYKFMNKKSNIKELNKIV